MPSTDNKDAFTLERIRQLDEQVKSFGGARLPLNEMFKESRVVVAGSRIFSISPNWSFHDFLLSYGLSLIGKSIVRAEADRQNPRHPLAACLLAARAWHTEGSDGRMQLVAADPNLYAFLKVSYDLFTVADNAKLQEEMVKRLHKFDQYQGARYELFVAAALVRGGFKIEYEDESDNTTSHCEFTAVDQRCGKAYSVEAKSRKSGGAGDKAKLYRLLQRALRKNANHERLVFIDVNRSPDTAPIFEAEWQREVMATVSELEATQHGDRPWPQALLFFTNRLAPGWPQLGAGGGTTVFTAINHPLFKSPDRSRVEQAYPEVGRLFGALVDLMDPPRDFFGQ